MDKPIVVLDTNVIISAVFWEGKSYIVVKKAINQEIIVFIKLYHRRNRESTGERFQSRKTGN